MPKEPNGTNGATHTNGAQRVNGGRKVRRVPVEK